MTYEFRKNNFRPTDGFPARVRISKMCRKVPRPLQNKKFLLLGSISLPGFCPIDLSGKPSRYRSLLESGPTQTISHGLSRPGLTQYSGQRQSSQRLAYLCRFRSSAHPHRVISLCQRRFRPRIGSNGLRSGFHDHRFVSIPFPMGEVPKTKRGCKIAYPPGFTREYSYRNLNYSRKSPRHTNARPSMERTRGHLSHGSWLCRFCSSLQNPSGYGLLCNSDQKQFQFQTSLFPPHRQVVWTSMRSNYCPGELLRQERLSGKTKTHPLLRPREKPAPYILNQQFFPARLDYHRAVSMSLASRVVFQMDQTTSTNQGILWHFRKCGQDPNMDCHLGLSARGHNQETVKLRFEPLHNFTDFERHAFRKNPYFTGSFVGSHPVSRGAYR